MSLLYTILAFIVAVGILVTVHEFGHYWVARRLGVKILRFSVGFGQPLFSKRLGKDQTEFVIAAVPLGGYVKMLDEQEGAVDPSEQHRAFNRQSLKVRTAVVVAGPLFNFIFAILAYAVMYLIGITGMAAYVGEVAPGSLADQAGFQRGQQIVAVNNEPVQRWQSVIQATLPLILDHELIHYQVLDEDQREMELRLDMRHLTLDDIGEGQFFAVTGLSFYRPLIPAHIGEIVIGSPADQAGLRVGDIVLQVDGQAVQGWMDWANYIATHPEHPMQTQVLRNGETVMLTLTPARNEAGQGRVGVRPMTSQIPERYIVTERYGPLEALGLGISKTWDLTLLTLRVMGKMLTLQLSPSNISGPITIAEYAGQSAQSGFTTFLFFLGLVSLSLGIINLMPIPLLDGGHLLLYTMEWFKGSPVAESTQIVMQKIGLTLVLALMGLAIFNDIDRLFS